jgi:hypothetical protein
VFGLRMSMLSSGLAFCAAGGIWLSLPETLRKKKALVPLSCG